MVLATSKAARAPRSMSAEVAHNWSVSGRAPSRSPRCFRCCSLLPTSPYASYVAFAHGGPWCVCRRADGFDPARAVQPAALLQVRNNGEYSFLRKFFLIFPAYATCRPNAPCRRGRNTPLPPDRRGSPSLRRNGHPASSPRAFICSTAAIRSCVLPQPR